MLIVDHVSYINDLPIFFMVEISIQLGRKLFSSHKKSHRIKSVTMITGVA